MAKRARPVDPGAQGAFRQQRSVRVARHQLGYHRAGRPRLHGDVTEQAAEGGVQLLGRHGPEVGRAETEEAEQKRKDAIQKQRENIESLFNLRRSRSDDPVRGARLTLKEIDTLLNIPGLSRNERRELQARRNEAVRDLARQKSDEKMRELDLEHDIGKISDSAYLAKLKQAYLDAKRGTQLRKDLREKFLRFKHQMEESDDLPELNVGNIRLPTAYDVRRLIRQGTDASQRTVNQANTIHVYASGGDPEQIAASLGHHLNTQTRSGLRAAGAI